MVWSKGYFDWLESKTYKMHVRVLLSCHPSHQPCPTCKGGRFQPETLNYRIEPAHLTIADVAARPVSHLAEIIGNMEISTGILTHDSCGSRYAYVISAKLVWEILIHRPTRSLSGGNKSNVSISRLVSALLW